MLPQPPMAAVIGLGMGPVVPQLRGPKGKRRPVTISPWMRHNAIAIAEIVDSGLIEENGYIIPSGFPARKEDMNRQLRETPRTQREAYGRPASTEEEMQIRKTSEAKLMGWLIGHAVARSATASRKYPNPTVLEEREASNTIQNFVRAINLLDKRSYERTGGLFEGNIAFVASEFGHVARAKEILNALGFDDERIVPITAQQVLRHFGYKGNLYPELWHGKPYEKQMQDTKLSQERWRRGVREKPAYVLTEIIYFEKNARLMQVMAALGRWYGQEDLGKFSLGDFAFLKPEDLRRILGSIDRNASENWPEEAIPADTSALTQEIEKYKRLTEQWLRVSCQRLSHA